MGDAAVKKVACDECGREMWSAPAIHYLCNICIWKLTPVKGTEP